MAGIWIYGDESGTMPASDDDEPFVAALITSRSPISKVKRSDGSAAGLVSTIDSEGLLTSIAYVKPRAGFSHLWAAKSTMIDTMARARRLVTGTHEYLPERGFARGNFIWVRTMQEALLQAILSSLAQGVVDEIRLILDRKSLAAATERFMRDRVGAMVPLVQDQLAQMLVEYPAGAAQIAAYQNNLQANGIVFEWGNPESIDGLWLAHRLALLSHRELHEKPETSLFDALARLGNRSAPIDVTDSVIREISRAAIERWRRDTGLPVPRG